MSEIVGPLFSLFVSRAAICGAKLQTEVFTRKREWATENGPLVIWRFAS